MVDTRSVSDDQGRTFVGFCFFQSFYQLVRVCTQSNLCYVYIAIAHSQSTQVFLHCGFTACCELCNSTDRCSFGGLTACVGVYFCIYNQNVYVTTGSQNVVQTAVTDIVCPAVAAVHPHGFLCQVFAVFLDECFQFSCFAFYIQAFQSCQQCAAVSFGSVAVIPVFQPYVRCCCEVCAFCQSQQIFYFHCDAVSLLFNSQYHTNGELCVVFEQGVGPCRTPAFFVCCVRNTRSSCAPSLCTACCVCQIHSVTVQLSHQFCVSCFAAASTCAREFQQRLFELRAFYGEFVHGVGFVGQCQGEVPVCLFGHLCIQRFHYQSFFFCGTCCYADTTALTIQRIYLHTEFVLFDVASADGIQYCVGFRSVSRFFFCQQERSDCSVRTYIRTLVTLDTVCCDPFGNVDGNTTFFECGCAQRSCTVFSACEYGCRQQIAFQCVHRYHQFFNVFRQYFLDCFFICVYCIFPASGNVNFHQTGQTSVYSSVVHVNNFFTFFTVGFYDRCFHVVYSVIYGDDVSQFEECGLQDRICFVAQTDFFTDLDGVDCIEVDIVVRNIFFHVSGQVFVQFFCIPCTVQQECTAGFDFGNDIIFFHVGLVMTSNEVCVLCYQIAGTDGCVTETQVRSCDTAGFLCIVFEVSLCVFVCVVTDDLDGVFVCTNSTVGAQTPEFTGYCAFVRQVGFFCYIDVCVGDVIDDTNCEVVFLSTLHVVEYSDDLTGCHVFGRQTVTTSQYFYHSAFFDQCGTNVCVQGFTQCTGFFCSVQNCDHLSRFGQSSHEVFQGERSVQVNLQETYFFALSCQGFYYFLSNACYGTHSNDHVFCIGSTEVVEQLIVSACDLVDFMHVVFYDFGKSCVERCACFSVLEEYVGVLYCGTLNGMFGVQCVLSEFFQSILVDQFFQIFIVHYFDFLQFVGSTETIEEVDERYGAFDCGQVSNTSQIHYFLNGSGGQHSAADLTASHNVGVVTEDGESVCTYCTGRYVEYTGFQLTSDSVHRGDHQQQTLRSCVCSCQSACFQGAVHRTSCTCFRFQFQQTYCLAEQVLLTICGPAVYVFRHGGRGSDGVNSSYFCKCIRDICSSFITVHGFHDFCAHG